MSGDSYSVRTAIEMARIPPEAWQRFAAELPALLAVIAPVVSLYDEMRAAGADIPDEAYERLLAKLDWFDDDKGTIGVTVIAENEDGTVADTSTHHFQMPRDASA